MKYAVLHVQPLQTYKTATAHMVTTQIGVTKSALTDILAKLYVVMMKIDVIVATHAKITNKHFVKSKKKTHLEYTQPDLH